MLAYHDSFDVAIGATGTITRPLPASWASHKPRAAIIQYAYRAGDWPKHMTRGFGLASQKGQATVSTFAEDGLSTVNNGQSFSNQRCVICRDERGQKPLELSWPTQESGEVRFKIEVSEHQVPVRCSALYLGGLGVPDAELKTLVVPVGSGPFQWKEFRFDPNCIYVLHASNLLTQGSVEGISWGVGTFDGSNQTSMATASKDSAITPSVKSCSATDKLATFLSTDGTEQGSIAGTSFFFRGLNLERTDVQQEFVCYVLGVRVPSYRVTNEVKPTTADPQIITANQPKATVFISAAIPPDGESSKSALATGLLANGSSNEVGYEKDTGISTTVAETYGQPNEVLNLVDNNRAPLGKATATLESFSVKLNWTDNV